jgi:hypothetical protein
LGDDRRDLPHVERKTNCGSEKPNNEHGRVVLSIFSLWGVCVHKWFAWETDVGFGCSLFLLNCWMTPDKGEIKKRLEPEYLSVMGDKRAPKNCQRIMLSTRENNQSSTNFDEIIFSSSQSIPQQQVSNFGHLSRLLPTLQVISICILAERI